MKKTDAVKEAIRKGDYKKALRIAKEFRYDISPEERDAMAMAYECMVHPKFYEMIGVDTEAAVAAGVETAIRKYRF